MISIITPVLNEEEWIAPFLFHLSEFEEQFDCTVVDGGSTDGTIPEVQRMQKIVPYPLRLVHAPRGRALQMNAGAQTAAGDILLFLHVDCVIPPDSLKKIYDAVWNGYAGGGFIHSFNSRDPILRVTSMVGNVHARITKIFFGDFGIFVRKDVFDRVGGYDEAIPFLEDVEFCRDIRRVGKLTCMDSTILSSARRYVSRGKIRLSLVFAMVIALNLLGIRPRFFVPYIVDR